MEIRKTKLGADHHDTLNSMHNLACVWKEQGCNVEAINLMGECVQLSHRVLGVFHLDYVSSFEMLSQWEVEQADNDALN
jgi:hypothetical protein